MTRDRPTSMIPTEPIPDATAPDDAGLLRWLRQDPVAALSSVLARFEARLLRHARAVLLDATAAEDVVQDAFLRLLDHSGRIDSLGGWLFRVTHNLALDHLRKEKRMRSLHLAAAPETEPQTEPAEAGLLRREALGRVEQALALLTANERAVIVLKVHEGRSYREISEVTGLSTSNVGYLLHHGLRKLGARLRQEGGV